MEQITETAGLIFWYDNEKTLAMMKNLGKFNDKKEDKNEEVY
jgi:hypothetical protein